MRSQSLTATFENWKLPNGQVIRGKFEILLTLEYRGSRNYRWIPRIRHTQQSFGKDFAESKLHEAKESVGKQFETQVSDWA